MVRTRADAGATKVSAAKAPRKVLSSNGGSSSSFTSPGRSSGKDKYSGGNSYNPQPTPSWQKGIGSFFKATPKEVEEGEGSNSKGSDSTEENTPPSPQSGSNFTKNGMISDDDD